jgi:hypothetical protein
MDNFFCKTFQTIQTEILSRVFISPEFPFSRRNIPKEQSKQLEQMFLGLWDTGSDYTSICYSKIDQLGRERFQKVDEARIKGIGEVKTRNVYRVGGIQIETLKIYSNFLIVEDDLTNNKEDMILGMDIISQGTMTISNKNWQTEFCFELPSQHTFSDTVFGGQNQLG